MATPTTSRSTGWAAGRPSWPARRTCSRRPSAGARQGPDCRRGGRRPADRRTPDLEPGRLRCAGRGDHDGGRRGRLPRSRARRSPPTPARSTTPAHSWPCHPRSSGRLGTEFYIQRGARRSPRSTCLRAWSPRRPAEARRRVARDRRRNAMMGCVTIVKINAITVPEDSGDELGRRFAKASGRRRRPGRVRGLRAPPAHRRPHHVARDDPMARRGCVPGGSTVLRSGMGTPAPTSRTCTQADRCPCRASCGRTRSLDLARPVAVAGPEHHTASVDLRDVHIAGAWVVVVGNALAGVWALGAHRWPALRRPSLWWLTAAAEIAIAVEVLLGVILVVREDRETLQFRVPTASWRWPLWGSSTATATSLPAAVHLLYRTGRPVPDGPRDPCDGDRPQPLTRPLAPRRGQRGVQGR